MVLYYLLSWSVYYSAQLVGLLGIDGVWDRDYGWGVRVRRHFGARSSVRYGTRLGDLKESCFLPELTQVLNSVNSVLLRQETATWGGLDLGDGFWNGDYGWGVRVGRPFGARRRSSVRYGTRLSDLK